MDVLLRGAESGSLRAALTRFTSQRRLGRKLAKNLRVTGDRRGLLLALAVLLGPLGCLVPQNIDPSSNAPHAPPRIDGDSIPADLFGPYVTLLHGQLDQSQNCHCDLELSIPLVDDDDALARLEVRWFIDYDPLKPLTQRLAVPTSFIEGSFDTSVTERPGPTLAFELAALGVADGFHSVDVVIAEAGSFEDSSSAALPNRGMKLGYKSTEHRFVVQVLTDNNHQCSNVPPSLRLCAGGSDGGPP